MRQLTEQSTSESGPPENSIDDRTVAFCKVTNFVLPPLLSYVDCYSAIIFSLYEVICWVLFFTLPSLN